ncbi:MAG: Ser-Thr-rich GPI-anchored membrane family protein [Candidatus Taylorbacteria bacterium]
MKNSQKGFVVPLLVAIIALLVIGGGVYVYDNKKADVPAVVDNTTQQSNQVQQTNTQNPPVTASTNNQSQSANPDGNYAPNPSKGSSITVISPKNNVQISSGQTYTIKWTSVNVGNQVVFITLLSDRNTLVSSLADGVPNSGSYSWKVGASIPKGNYQIVIGTSENMPTGANTASGKSGMFSISSNVSAPKAPVISSVSYSPTQHSSGGSYSWSDATVYGSGFSSDKVYLVNSSTGADITQLSIDTPTGNPTNSTQFVVQIPNTIVPGQYAIVVEDSIFGLRSQPYTFTVTSGASVSSWQTYSNPQYGFSIQYPSNTQVNDTDISGGRNISFTTSQGIVMVEVVTQAWNNGTLSSPPNCNDTAGGQDRTNTSINGINFLTFSMSKEMSGMNSNVSATEYCAIQNGTAYKVITRVNYTAGTSNGLGLDKNATLNQMISTFKITR